MNKRILVILLAILFALSIGTVFAATGSTNPIDAYKTMDEENGSMLVLSAKITQVGPVKGGMNACKSDVIASYDRYIEDTEISVSIPNEIAVKLKKGMNILLFLNEKNENSKTVYTLVASPSAVMYFVDDVKSVHSELIKHRKYITKAELIRNSKENKFLQLISKMSSYDPAIPYKRFPEFYAGSHISTKGEFIVYYKQSMALSTVKKALKSYEKDINSIKLVPVKYSYNELEMVRLLLKKITSADPFFSDKIVDHEIRAEQNKIIVYMFNYSPSLEEQYKKTILNWDGLGFSGDAKRLVPEA